MAVANGKGTHFKNKRIESIQTTGDNCTCTEDIQEIDNEKENSRKNAIELQRL